MCSMYNKTFYLYKTTFLKIAKAKNRVVSVNEIGVIYAETFIIANVPKIFITTGIIPPSKIKIDGLEKKPEFLLV